MTIPETLFGGLDAATFLRDYWQQRPLLVRGALPGWTSPLAPADLLALATEEEAQARLILETGGEYPWELRHGPFRKRDLARLPKTNWTVLVQEVDRLVPVVADLLDHFRWIPNWRLDDVMVSYAPSGGGVGAHIDQYDVFLLQGLGQRRWQINTTPVEEEHLVPDLDVRILADFVPDAEWVLAPGDLLYLPPRIAHYGVSASDDCMTYSIGFRAPSHADLVAGLMEHLLETLDPALRYSDPGRSVAVQPGEVEPAVRAHVRHLLRALLADDRALDTWFGTFLTAPKRASYAAPLEDPLAPAALAAYLGQGALLRRRSLPDFAHMLHTDGTATLFVSGTAYELEGDLAFAAPLITGTALLHAATLQPHLNNSAFVELLTTLVNAGELEVDEG
jgi:50S ribosomal protein L16 3-hydroxylase